jgi:ATP-binding cassette, subfamily F, member 3
MIHIEGLTKRYGDKVLFEDASWHVGKRERIGLTGVNGAGKTTLLRLLAGTETPDSGSIRMASDTTIGYLPQDGIVHHGRTVYEEVVLAFDGLLKLKDEQHRIEDALAHASEDDTAGHEGLLERYAEVTERFRHLGGYEIDLRVAEVLRGLGFSHADQARATTEFSGGWQMRIALAKLLLARPNLLLMDEPTNHLDLPARNWLEEYLAVYPGAVVLVSHDRYFLDATITRITEVGLKTLTDYHGNYSYYAVEHAARMDRLLEAHRRQAEEIEKTQAFINRFRYQATKARQVQSRIKQLDKVERIDIPPERKKIRFHFPEAPRPGRIVLEAHDLRKVYGDRVVLRGVELLVERGDRLALVGPNGAGKSTLMRLLAGVDRPDAGASMLGHKVVLDYFAQDQAAVLNPTRTVYEEMSSASPTTMVPMIRNILGGFLFSGDDVNKRVSVLSGGERNRLAIAKMLLNPSNLLLLDEPTNHLDLDSKEVLLEALADYHGTLLFVSHDRYFVDRLASKVIEVGESEILLYPGGYEDFLDWRKRRLAEGLPLVVPSALPRVQKPPAQHAASQPSRPDKPAPNRKPPSARSAQPGPSAARDHAPAPNPLAPRLRPKNAPPERQLREREARRLKAQISELEKQIAAKEQSIRELEQAMSTPGFYDDRQVSDRAVGDYETLKTEVGALMSTWEQLQAQIEVLTAGSARP